MLLHGTHRLADGRRVRLRLPQAGDRAGLHELLAGLGLAAEDLEVRRALRCTPRERVAVCATAWDGAFDVVVGFGALEGDALTLLGEPAVADALREALHEHAGTWSRRVA